MKHTIMSAALLTMLFSGCVTQEEPRENVRRFNDLGVAVECEGCPRLFLDHNTAELRIQGEQLFRFTGEVDSRGPVTGVWRIYNGELSEFGPIDLLSLRNDFDQPIPLWCGENLLEVYFSSQDGVTIWRQVVVAEDCSGGKPSVSSCTVD